MGEVKIPFEAADGYGVVSLKHPNLSEEEAASVLRSQINFTELHLLIERHNE